MSSDVAAGIRAARYSHRSPRWGKSRSPHTTSVGAAIRSTRSYAGAGAISVPRCSARSAMPFISRKSVRTAPPHAALRRQRSVEPRVRFERVDPVDVGLRLGLLHPVDPRLDRGRERRLLRRARDRRRDQHERAHALRHRERGVDRDAPALRAADQHGGRATGGRIENRGEIRDVRIALVGVQRFAEAAPVVGDAAIAAGNLERGEFRPPHPAVGDAGVQEHDGRPRTAHFGGEFGVARANVQD